MGSSSEDDSEISDSDIDSYKEKTYDELKAGKYKVKISNDIYRCPFCLGKKKQHHDYKGLLQHSSGVGKGSASRRAKQKANHLALAKYMETCLAMETEVSLGKTNEPDPAKAIVALEPDTKPEQEDIFVWPWTGIIVNILTKPRDEDADLIKREFSKFNPVNVQTLWSRTDQKGYAIIDFYRDWAGFKDAIAFEKEFESKRRGKKNWNDWKSDPGSRWYGWVARAEDYHLEGKIGQHLRNNGEVKTIADIVKEAAEKKQKKVADLTSKIDAKNEHLNEMQSKYNTTSMSLDRLMEEKEKLQQNHNEEIKKLQRSARERTHRILYESEQLKRDLDSRRRDIDYWSKELNKREAFNERQRRKLDEDMSKSVMKNNSLDMASMEQKKADENVLRLIEDHKREKEAALNKILLLEKKLDAKQKLELEIEEMKGNLQVMKHMGGDDDQKIQEKMKEIDEELKDKIEEMEGLEALNQTLLVKERKSNDELQEARKELVSGLRDMLGVQTAIIVKGMGELDDKPFQKVCKQRFPTKVAAIKAAELCSMWQEHIRNPEWFPFKVVEEEGKTK
ncbi:Factor of dna methylation, partial [Thalictrum thalictroides]